MVQSCLSLLSSTKLKQLLNDIRLYCCLEIFMLIQKSNELSTFFIDQYILTVVLSYFVYLCCLIAGMHLLLLIYVYALRNQ